MPRKKNTTDFVWGDEVCRLLAERTSDIVAIADSDGVIRYVNPAVRSVTGYAPEEVIGTNIKSWVEAMGEEYYEIMTRTIEEDKTPFSGEVRGKRKNGEVYTANVTIIPILDGKRNIQWLLGIQEDITSEQAVVRLRVRTEDLHAANERLAHEKARDEALLESIGEGMAAIDTESRVFVMNTAAEEMLGWKASAVIGKKWDEFLRMENEWGEVVSSDKRPIRIALLHGKKFSSGDYYYVRRDNTRFPVMVTASPVILNNIVRGAIVVFRDITKEKEVDKMKTEFLSVASHQLRTPLTAIRLFTEMLSNEARAGKLNEKQKDYLDQINQSTKRMIELVNDLLNVSRIETGRLKIDPKPTDLKEFLRQILKDVEEVARERGCKLALEAKEKFPNVPLDRTLFREVIQNLVANAVRYSKIEQCSVSVEITKNEKEYVIAVRDSGIGIPKEAQPRIFEKFFRADNAIKKEAEGSGLGLYVVKMVVEASGGRIWFESEEGEGTTFYVTIPLKGMRAQKGEKTLAT